MTRSLLYGVVLVSAAAGAALWAASPGCEGSFCLGAGGGPAVQAVLPEPAAQDPVETEDLERLWREAEPARPVAEAAPADPTEAETTVEPAEPGSAERDGDSEHTRTPGLAESGEETADSPVPEGWAEVAEAALTEPDDAKRGQAIHAVGNLRNAEAVAVLSEAAVQDPDPGNRLEALQSLWFSAADGLDEDGEIRRLLEAAQSDPDPDIAELAQKAVADLDKLEARRAALPAVAPAGDADVEADPEADG